MARPPKIITTLHGTDTTLLGQDPSYRPAIEHALSHSDAITTVSESLRQETVATFQLERPVEVILQTLLEFFLGQFPAFEFAFPTEIKQQVPDFLGRHAADLRDLFAHPRMREMDQDVPHVKQKRVEHWRLSGVHESWCVWISREHGLFNSHHPANPN